MTFPRTGQGVTSEASPYPLRVAAIDVGSNAIRFVAVEFVDARRRVEIEAQRVPVRLGQGAFLTGAMDEDAVAAAVAAMSSLRRSIDALGVGAFRVVATSAVRESRNGRDLVARVRRASGLHVEVIGDREEARLVWRAAGSRIDWRDERWLLADLGGGSLEVALVSAGGIHESRSHPLGTVRLLDLARLHGGDVRAPIEERAAALHLPEVAPRDVEGLVATGGNVEALARLAGATPDERGVARLPLEALRRVIRLLASMGAEERGLRLDLRSDRADVILPAALVYEHVAVASGQDTLIVPHVGVKEGILLDLHDEFARPGHVLRRQRRVVEGAVALGRRFHFDEGHGRRVAHLAASLFEALRGPYGLAERDRLLLLAAAVLHDVGRVLSPRGHHRHSHYILRNAELPGIGSEDVPLVALVARYHRGAEPRKGHAPFRALDEEARRRVRRMASILRIADALDPDHLQRVERVLASVDDGRLRLDVLGHGEPILDGRALRRKARMFEAVFGLGVDVREAPGSRAHTPKETT